MDLRQVFASNLRRLRHAQGLSQEDLAHEADVNRTYMSKIEKGGTWVGLEIIGKLAKVAKVEPAELLRLPLRGVASRNNRGVEGDSPR
jgi:transcriptional regulator with XRE-family HTH domain